MTTRKTQILDGEAEDALADLIDFPASTVARCWGSQSPDRPGCMVGRLLPGHGRDAQGRGRR